MGEKGITISDTKTVKVDVFEDSDLLSEEEKAAMAEDTAEEEAEQKAAQAAGAGDDEAAAAAKLAQEEADEQKAKEVAEADANIATEKAKADKAAGDEAAKAAADKEAGKGKEAGDESSTDGAKETIVSQTPPPVMLESLSPEQLEKIKTDLEDNEKKFQDGEVDYRQYFDKRLNLERAIWQNEIAVELSSSGVENQWQWEQNTFLNDAPNAWINDDEVVYAAFSATVNRIMSTEEGATMPGPELLDKARTEVAARFSPTKETDDTTAAESKKKAAALKAAKKAQGDKTIPVTLADLPAADQEDGVGEFGWIDKLDGEAYEKAVDGLSEAQLARYEADV